MKDYKQWTASERQKSHRLLKKAISDGDVPEPTKCNRCDVSYSIRKIQYHTHDYSHPTKFIEPVCIICHRKIHKLSTDSKEIAYFEQLWLMKHKYD